MPIISGGSAGGGSLPNPITTPVTITPSADTDTSLSINGAAAGTNDLLDVNGTQVHPFIDAQGKVTLRQNVDTGTFAPLMDVVFRSDMQSDLLAFDQGFGGFATVFRINKHGYPIIGLNAAPADAELSAGQLAFWFDQTNGAAALMVKAKQADGTVEVGRVTVALPTSGALPTVQLVTATGAQILTSRDTETVTPCTFNPGAATTATVTVALSPDNVTYSTLGIETEPAGVAFDGTIHLVKVRVPAGWYLKLTVNAQATLGLTTYY